MTPLPHPTQEPHMPPIHLLVLCGSARAGSLNRKLAAVAGAAAREAGAEVT